MVVAAEPGLERKLRREVAGEVMFDAFSRGRYATDASHYQIMPAGVVVPQSRGDIEAVIAIAGDHGVPVTARGGGTSQCGQTINRGLIVDTSKHLNRILELDAAGERCLVEPGIVLDDLNRQLKPHGLWFPVDVSTASRATIGGMTGNNSCGGRSLRYGTTRDNVLSIEAILADGTSRRFGAANGDAAALDEQLLEIGVREADEVVARFPRVQRRVGGYNIDALAPGNAPNNMAHVLVGSEGTLGFSTAIELKLWPVMGRRVMGVCHFATFYQAMDAAQHLVTLQPLAVELVDATMIGLARDIEMFQPVIAEVVRDEPAALLVVEFMEDSDAGNQRKLNELDDMMGALGFSWQGEGNTRGGVVRAEDARVQTAITEMRKSGLNIMMSMKQEGKPVSFVEDCAVELPDLAEYTARLTDIFEKHGTRGTWYAHASVGCLHVRPVLNLKLEKDVKTMRAIAEEAFEMVRSYKGSHSGEHGDGMVRSEFHEKMFGARLVRAFEDVKSAFDPKGLFNPGKIVSPTKMDDRTLLRFKPDYSVAEMATVLDWSAWPGAGGGFQGAVEMCNNNGACRKLAGGAMCPSYRVTRNERDVTRGRANVLRLAISGQLGADALTSDAMAEAMKLCVSCKACRRECPTGVDMARMKIEVQAARARAHGLRLQDRLIGYLPRYAPHAAKLAPVMNLRNSVPGLAGVLEGITGFAAGRKLPAWRGDWFRDAGRSEIGDASVVVFADTFNRYFEPENLRAAVKVLERAGLGALVASDGGRPLCCGRTFLSSGLVDEARAEAERLVAALLPHAEAGRTIVGLEPSCTMTLKDEIPALLQNDAARLVASHVQMFEDHIARCAADGSLDLPLKPLSRKALLHGHCHQKSYDAMSGVTAVLGLVPELEVETIQSGCCGMAGAFGYGRDTADVSIQMAELDLLPAVRAEPDALVIADGTSCRHQIADGAGREALHVARVLEMALA